MANDCRYSHKINPGSNANQSENRENEARDENMSQLKQDISNANRSGRNDLKLGDRKRKVLSGHICSALHNNDRRITAAGDGEELKGSGNLPQVDSSSNEGNCSKQLEDRDDRSGECIPHMGDTYDAAKKALVVSHSLGKSLDGDTDLGILDMTLPSKRKLDKGDNSSDASKMVASKAIDNSNAYVIPSPPSGSEKHIFDETRVACSKRLRVRYDSLEQDLRTYNSKSERDFHDVTVPKHLCGASSLKERVDPKESLAVAKKQLNSSCKQKEANLQNAGLKLSKKIILLNEKKIKEPYFSKDHIFLPEDTTREPLNSRRPVMAEKGTPKIKLIQRKCEEDMVQLVQMQQEEIQEFLRNWEQKRIKLEKEHKRDAARICSMYRNTMKTDKLEELDNEFVKNMKELKCQKDICLKNLEYKQLCARNKERQREAHLLEEAKSNASEERAYNDLSLHGSQNRNQVGCTETCELGTQDIHGTLGCSILAETPNVVVNTRARNEVEVAAFDNASSDIVEKPNNVSSSNDVASHFDDHLKESLAHAKNFNLSLKKEEATSIDAELKLSKDMLSCTEKIKEPYFPEDCKSASEVATRELLNSRVLQSISVNLQTIETEIDLQTIETEIEEILKSPRMVENRTLKIIKRIRKKCKKRMVKLVKKQQEEIQEFHRTWEQKRVILEKECKMDSGRICSMYNHTMETDNLDTLDNEFDKKMEEYKCQKDFWLKRLEDNQLSARNEESRKAAHWLAEAKFYATEDRAHSQLPLHGFQNTNPMGYFEPSELRTQDKPGNVFSSSRDYIKKPNPDEIRSDSENASIDRIEKPNRGSNSIDVFNNVISTSPFDPARCSQDGSLAHTRAEEVSNEELGIVDFVGIGTLAVESNEENVQGDAVGSNRLGSEENLEDGAKSSIIGKLAPMGEKIPAIQPVIPLVCDYQLGPNTVLEKECSQPLACHEMRVEGNQSSLEGGEVVPPLTPFDDGQTDQANHENLLIEPSEELHLPQSINLPLVQDQIDVPPSSGLLHECLPFESQMTDPHDVSVSELAEDPPGLLDSTVMQSGENDEIHPFLENEAGLRPASRVDHHLVGESSYSSRDLEFFPEVIRFNAETPNHCSFYHQVTSRLLTLPLHAADPLRTEFARLFKEKQQAIKFHDNMKLRLKSDCDKEILEAIAQINSKYDARCQDAEVAFQQKKLEHDKKHQKVFMNKALAEVFRHCCQDWKPSGTIGMQRDLHTSVLHQLWPLPSLQLAPMPSHVVASSAAAQPSSDQPVTPPPPLQIVHQLGALFSNIPTRSANTSLISPSFENLRLGCEIQARAPDIQSFRHAESSSPFFLTSYSQTLTSQHEPTSYLNLCVSPPSFISNTTSTSNTPISRGGTTL